MNYYEIEALKSITLEAAPDVVQAIANGIGCNVDAAKEIPDTFFIRVTKISAEKYEAGLKRIEEYWNKHETDNRI